MQLFRYDTLQYVDIYQLQRHFDNFIIRYLSRIEFLDMRNDQESLKSAQV